MAAGFRQRTTACGTPPSPRTAARGHTEWFIPLTTYAPRMKPDGPTSPPSPPRAAHPISNPPTHPPTTVSAASQCQHNSPGHRRSRGAGANRQHVGVVMGTTGDCLFLLLCAWGDTAGCHVQRVHCGVGPLTPPTSSIAIGLTNMTFFHHCKQTFDSAPPGALYTTQRSRLLPPDR